MLFYELLETHVASNVQDATTLERLFKICKDGYIINSSDDFKSDRILTTNLFKTVITELSVGRYLKFHNSLGYPIALATVELRPTVSYHIEMYEDIKNLDQLDA